MIEPTRTPVARVAQALDCTEGQLLTMVIGLTFALLLAVPGIPAVLRDRPPAVEQSALTPRGSADDAISDVTAPAPESPTSVPPPPQSIEARGVPAAEPGEGAPTPPMPPPDGGSPPSDAAASRAPVGTIGIFAPVRSPGAPGGLAIGPDGTVFVTTDNGDARGGDGPSHVFAYDSGGVASSDLVIAGQPEERVGGLAGVAVGPDRGDLAVVDPEGRRIVSVDMAAGTQAVRARIPDLPVCLLPLATVACQPGVEDREPFPVSVAYDGARHLFVTDPAQDTIWRLRPGESSPEVWYQSVHFTTGAGPHGIAVDGASVTFTVGASHDLSALGAGALYRLAVEPDGSAGELTFVHAFPRGEPPGALALGSSGAAYVVLGSSGAIVTIARDGSQTGRIDPPGTGPIPLDSPSAVALVHGGLLVANGRTSDDAERWAVLTLVVDDGPVSAAATTDDRLRIRPSGRVP